MTHSERRQSWIVGWWWVGAAGLMVVVAALLAASTGHWLLLTVVAGFASYPLVIGLVDLAWSRWGRPAVRERGARRRSASADAESPAQQSVTIPERMAADRSHRRRALKLLVPLAGAEHDAAALATAVQLAKAAEAVVVLLHVATPRATPTRVAERGVWAAVEEEVAVRQHALTRQALAFGSLPVPVSVLVETLAVGEALPQCIARIAREQAADIIIVASRRAATLSGLVFGSVTEALLGSSPAPVLVVRPPAETTNTPAGHHHDRPGKVPG